MSLVAVPVNVPIVTTVAVARVVPPLNVAVTVTTRRPVVLLQESTGLAVRVIPDGASSSSVIVVVTVVLVESRLGDGPPPPLGLLMATVKSSPLPSSIASSVL